MKVKKPGSNNGLIVFSILLALFIGALYVNLGTLSAQFAVNSYSGMEYSLEREASSDKIASLTAEFVDKEGSWKMHSLDPKPPSGSDGVKLGDVNGDGWMDLVTGFEEGGVSRIYIHPGQSNVQQYWDYVELPSPDVEDAVLVDLNHNGVLDMVTASEGSTNQIMFHWAPDDPHEYMEASKWHSQIVPATDSLSAWMFVVPVDLADKGRTDLIVGSKRKRGEMGDDKAEVGWLKSPENPRNVDEWEYQTLSKAGWIMSIEMVDMNHDHLPDILISDRKFSTQTGVRWLENPAKEKRDLSSEWKSHMIGMKEDEPMFLTLTDLNEDGLNEIVVPDLYRGLRIFTQERDTGKAWSSYTVPYPPWAGPRGKSVSAGDINLDGNPDLVLSFEEEGKVAALPFEAYKAQGRYSVIGGSFQDDPFSVQWNFYKVSGLKGRKFDLVNLIDLDGDGDLDVLTNDENEEGEGLGVIWYENPVE